MGSRNKNSSNPRKLALIMGNDNYSQSINKLDHSVKNGKELAHLLESIDFQVKTEFNVSNEIMKPIKAFVDKFEIENGGLVLFYFSGHACQDDGENWLIPTDDSQISDIDAVKLLGTNANRILGRLLGSKNSPCTVICILDCCRPYNLGKNSASNIKGLHENKPHSGVFIQFACAANETTTNNLFAKHLLRKITTANKDVVEIFHEISNDVYMESNHKQKPLCINGLQDSKKIYMHEKTTLPEIPVNAVWRNNAFTVAGRKGHDKTLNRLSSPKGLCIDMNQDILIIDSSNYHIMKYERGRSSRPTTGKSKSSYGLDTLYKPLDATWSADQQSIIISDCHNLRMLKSTLKSTALRARLLKSSSCFALAVADDGTLYVSDTKLHEVRRYKPDEKYGTIVAGGNGSGRRLNQLNHPTYICIGKNQSIYVSDSFNDRVMRWDEDAKAGVIVAGGHGKGKSRNQLDYPAGIVVDSLSTVYVADSNNGRVMRWREGALRGDIIVGDRFRIGDGPQELNGPEGLAVDQCNNFYVADSNNHRIQRFEIE